MKLRSSAPVYLRVPWVTEEEVRRIVREEIEAERNRPIAEWVVDEDGRRTGLRFLSTGEVIDFLGSGQT